MARTRTIHDAIEADRFVGICVPDCLQRFGKAELSGLSSGRRPTDAGACRGAIAGSDTAKPRRVEGCLKCHNKIEPMHRYNARGDVFDKLYGRQRRAGVDLHGVSRRQSGGDDARGRARSAEVSKGMGLQEWRMLEPESRADEHAARKGEPRVCPLRQSRRFSRRRARRAANVTRTRTTMRRAA